MMNSRSLTVFTILNMLYLTLMIIVYIYSNKGMNFPFHEIGTPGILALPFAMLVIDMIAELYGYHIARQTIFCSLLILGFFCFVTAAFSYVPDPTTIPDPIPGIHYQAVFGILPRVFLACFIGITLGMLVNTKMLAKWYIIFKGKHFWLRSLGASIIGDGLFIFISTLINGAFRFPWSLLLKFCITNYIVEIILLLVLSPIANLIVNWLKKVLNIHLTSLTVDYNPFRK